MFTDNKNINAWNVPTLDLKKELQDLNENFQDKPYTIFDTAHVFREAKEIAELLQIDPTIAPRDISKDLVTYKPDRLALHALIVAISTKMTVSDEKQLNVLVNGAYNQLKNNDNYKDCIEQAYKRREEIEKQVTITLQDLIESKTINEYNDIEKVVIYWYKKLYNKSNNPNFGQYLQDYTVKKAIIAKAVDEIYYQEIKPLIVNFIDNFVDEVIQENNKLRISLPSPEERLTIMIAGGQASGKSGALKIVEASLKDFDKNLSNFVKINTDSYKPLILEPGIVNYFIYSQLTQPEASLIHSQIQDQITELVKQNKGPNVYIDQVYLGKDKLNMSLDGKGVAAIVVSTKVEDAIERSFDRGLKVENNQGRFEHTSGVLNGHKGVASSFINDIFDYVGENLNVLILDNNVEFGNPPIKIMEINLQTKEYLIHDERRLKDFIRKTTINTQATDRGSVYSSDSDHLTEEKYKEFVENLDKKLNKLTKSVEQKDFIGDGMPLTMFGKNVSSGQQYKISAKEQQSSSPPSSSKRSSEQNLEALAPPKKKSKNDDSSTPPSP